MGPENTLMADIIDEAYEIYDWIFIFEALHASFTADDTTMLDHQEKGLNKLKSLKHEQGSVQVWLQKFDDAIQEGEMMGAMVTNKMKKNKSNENVSKKIFESTITLWQGVLTRKSFPDKYDMLKACS